MGLSTGYGPLLRVWPGPILTGVRAEKSGTGDREEVLSAVRASSRAGRKEPRLRGGRSGSCGEVETVQLEVGHVLPQPAPPPGCPLGPLGPAFSACWPLVSDTLISASLPQSHLSLQSLPHPLLLRLYLSFCLYCCISTLCVLSH